ncbi:uncharacterized protein ACJ7VT_001901 isoform 2-T3 [Polymixia lowei]
MTSDQGMMLQALKDLVPVELKQFQCCLMRKVLKDYPPIPPQWLRAADTWATVQTMTRCYGEKGAMIMMAKVLKNMGCRDHVDQLQSQCSLWKHLPRDKPALEPSSDFVQLLRRKLISGMRSTEPILDVLQQHRLLDEAERAAVNIFAAQRDKNKALTDLVLRKDSGAQKVFHQALSQSDPFLLEELDSHPPCKEPGGGPVLRRLLGHLTSDELRLFQWCVTQHISEGYPPIGGNQLNRVEGYSPIGGNQLNRVEGYPPMGGNQLNHADRLATETFLERHYGSMRAVVITLAILLKIKPMSSIGLPGETLWSFTLSEGEPTPTGGTLDSNMTPIEITPDVHVEGDMFRLQCPWPGVFRCSLTGLVLKGDGEVVYWTVPWDRKFLASKGFRPAGPLFRFTCLKGSFCQLHLPHCETCLESHGVLVVAHVTEDRLEFLQPQKTTEKHVVINISGFSCFGLLKHNNPPVSEFPINGMVLLFHQPSDDPELYSSLYLLLLPRNALIQQATTLWKKRSGAEYVEALPDCELIPNQMYNLSGTPVQVIQPQNAKFLNFEDYDNYTASFEVQLTTGAKRVQLALKALRGGPHWLSNWLFGLHETVVWNRLIKLKAAFQPDLTAVTPVLVVCLVFLL